MAKNDRRSTARPPLERIMRIHERLQKNEFPNCTTMAREFEVGIRTLKRDIDFMKVRLKLPIAYHETRYGYFYTTPVDHFLHTAVTEAELFALLVAHKAISQYHGTPFQAPLEAAFRKLTGQLDQSSGFSLGNLGQMVSFRPFAPEDTDLNAFQTLTRAVQAKWYGCTCRRCAFSAPRLRYRNCTARRSCSVGCDQSSFARRMRPSSLTSITTASIGSTYRCMVGSAPDGSWPCDCGRTSARTPCPRARRSGISREPM